MAEQAAKALLEHPDWKMRIFGAIKKKDRGFDDDELRKFLIRAGALRFQADDGTELWGLVSRNQEELKSARSTEEHENDS